MRELRRRLRRARYRTIIWLAAFFTRWEATYSSRPKVVEPQHMLAFACCCEGCCYSLGHTTMEGCMHFELEDIDLEDLLPHPEGALPGCYWPYPHEADDPDCNCCLVCHPHPVPGLHA